MQPSIFTWLAGSDLRYACLAMGVFATLVLLCFTPRLHLAGSGSAATRALAHPVLFALAVLATLLAFRWPGVFSNYGPNPDESQIIAGAVTLRQPHAIFWRDLDGLTSGPLNFYVLFLAPYFGLKFDFVGIRILAIALDWAAIVGVWIAVDRYFNATASRLATLPALLVVSRFTFINSHQYQSELVSLFLLGSASAVLAATAQTRSDRLGWLGACLGGILLGLIPYAKLQAVPLGIATGLLFLLLMRRETGLRVSFRQWLVIAGALAPSAIVALFLTEHHLWAEFYSSYLRGNVAYTQQHPASLGQTLLFWLRLLPSIQGYAEFVFSLCTIMALWMMPFLEAASPGKKAILPFLGLVATAVYCILASHRPFTHYLVLLTLPSIPLLGCWIHHGMQAASKRAHVLLALTPILVIATYPYHLLTIQAETQLLLLTQRTQGVIAVSPVSYYLIMHAQANDRLSVWGWEPKYYAETGMPQGTRDGNTAKMIDSGTDREANRERYLADLRQNSPEWFVDSVAGGNAFYTNRARYGYESWPELAEEVRARYEFRTEIDGVRVFHRKPGSG